MSQAETAVSTPRTMRTFMIIWLGQIISIIGSGLTSFGLAVWIYDQTGQATPFALTVMFGNLPRILLSPIAGALVDRWNRRWVMILSDTGSALLTVGALVLLTFGQLQVWHIYLIAAIGSVLSTFQEPAYTASVSLLVPKKDLGRANGLMQMGQALEMLIAPLLAGVLFGLIGLRGLVVIDFVTFFFAVGALLVVQIPQPPRQETAVSDPTTSLWQEAWFGWHYLRQRRGLFGLLVYFALVNFFLNFTAVLLGPLVLSFSNSAALGTVQAIGGIGMLAGSIIMSAWGGPKQNRIPTVIGLITIASLGVFIAGLQPSTVFVATGLFILMICVPLGGGTSQAIFQSKIAPDVQGRVFAIRTMISRSMMPLAFLLAGPLADRLFGPLLDEGGALATTFVGNLVGVGSGRGIGLLFMAAATFLFATSLLMFTYPRVRNLESELPDLLPDEPEGEGEVGEETAVPQPA